MANFYIPLVASPPIGDGSGGGGSGGGALVVNVTDVDGTPTCDKTAGEMAEAYLSGGVIIFVEGMYYNIVFAQGLTDEEGYTFATNQGDSYEADTASDYPTGWVP